MSQRQPSKSQTQPSKSLMQPSKSLAQTTLSDLQETTVLILGAGPAGLSLGYELSQRQVPYLILDKEPIVGSTFAKMTDSTTYGPWLNNSLAGSPKSWSQKFRRTTRPEYAGYLVTYAKEHALNLRLGARVTRVIHDGAFLVETEQGRYRAPILVNATGQYSSPHRPDFPGQELCRIPRIHSAEYRSPDTVRSLAGNTHPKVLIVGSGLSAGEIMQELHQAGCEVQLSYRERIDTWPSPLEEALLSPWTYLWENLSLRLGLSRPSNLRPRLRRGTQWNLLRTHQVVSHPEIARLEPEEVQFLDGARDSYDVIILATGYRPALAHLKPMITGAPRVEGLASVDVPDLFFLGLPGSRTFRSEFLRGIREDAEILAEELQSRASSLGSQMVVTSMSEGPVDDLDEASTELEFQS